MEMQHPASEDSDFINAGLKDRAHELQNTSKQAVMLETGIFFVETA